MAGHGHRLRVASDRLKRSKKEAKGGEWEEEEEELGPRGCHKGFYFLFDSSKLEGQEKCTTPKESRGKKRCKVREWRKDTGDRE